MPKMEGSYLSHGMEIKKIYPAKHTLSGLGKTGMRSSKRNHVQQKKSARS